MANQDSTTQQLERDPLATYEIAALRAQIKAALSLLMSADEYGQRGEAGETMCDVGFILTSAIERLGNIFDQVDRLEGVQRIFNSVGEHASAHALQNTKEKRAGAIAGMGALRNIEHNAERMKRRTRDDEGLSMDEWWSIQDDAVIAMHTAAGKQDAFMSGFLAMVAEYVMCAHDGGIPDMDTWTPEATMTEAEKAASRAKFAEEVTAVMA